MKLSLLGNHDGFRPGATFGNELNSALVDWNFAKTKNLLTKKGESLITFTRAGNATYADGDGKVKYAGANLALQSEDFATTWTQTGTTAITANAGTAPDGTETADLITADDGGSNGFYQSQGSNAYYSISVYAKSSAGTQLVLGVKLSTTFAGIAAKFDLSNGTAGAVTTYSGGIAYLSGGTSSIDSVGNGWYRCKIQNIKYPAAQNIMIQSSGGAILVWGAQVEIGPVCTPYVKTTTTVNGNPRFEHDSTGKCLGLIVETGRTNSATMSERLQITSLITHTGRVGTFLQGETVNFSGGGSGIAEVEYAITNVLPLSSATGTLTGTMTGATSGATATFSSNAVAWSVNTNVTSIVPCLDVQSPDGYYNAQTITASGAGTMTFGRTVTGTIGNVWAGGFWIRRRSGSTPVSIVVGDNVSQSIAVTSAWQRFMVNNTITATTVRLYIVISGATASDAIDVFGGQLELTNAVGLYGSYIPTALSIVNKPIETLLVGGTNFSSWYGGTNNTMYAEVYSPYVNVGNQFIYHFTDGQDITAGNNIQVYRSNASTYAVLGYEAGSSTGSAGVGGISTTIVKAATSFQTNNFFSAANGLAGSIDTSFNLLSMDRLYIGSRYTGGAAGLQTNGYIKRLCYWSKQLSQVTLQRITK